MWVVDKADRRVNAKELLDVAEDVKAAIECLDAAIGVKA